MTGMNEIKVGDHLKSNYDDYYSEGDSEWRRLGAEGKIQNIISLCSDLPKQTVLEVGAGEGSVLQGLSDSNFGENLYALEISPSGIEAIKNKGISRLVECKVFDGYHIPYENDTFDIAVLSHVVEHVEHPRYLLNEVSRVARFIVIEVPLEDTIRLPRDFVFSSVGHINYYSPKSIRLLVQSCSLRVIHQIVTNPSKGTYTFKKGYKGLINYYVKQALLKMLPAVATVIFTYHAALVCEKERQLATE